MSKFIRDTAVIPLTPATDMSEKRGYLVTIAGDVATLSASATVPAKGVVLDGEPTTGKVSVGILGGNIGTAPGKCSGTITKGDHVQQHTDGTILADAGSGARVIVGTALESGVDTEIIEVAYFTPLIKS